jgi:drug/metabolite transporter (DMT)-like permease
MTQNISSEVFIEIDEVKPNPFRALMYSRKFWLMMLDLVVSLVVYFVTKYAAPEMTTDVLFVIGALQPVFVMLIGAIAYEDGENAKAAAKLQSGLG